MKKIITEGRYSFIIEAKEKQKDGGDKKLMPAIDVRDGVKARKRVNDIIKQDNVQRGSKFIKPSYSFHGYTYNMSMKNK